MTWTGANNGSWETAANWTNKNDATDQHVPTANDDVQLDLLTRTIHITQAGRKTVNRIDCATGSIEIVSDPGIDIDLKANSVLSLSDARILSAGGTADSPNGRDITLTCASLSTGTDVTAGDARAGTRGHGGNIYITASTADGVLVRSESTISGGRGAADAAGGGDGGYVIVSTAGGLYNNGVIQGGDADRTRTEGQGKGGTGGYVHLITFFVKNFGDRPAAIKGGNGGTGVEGGAGGTVHIDNYKRTVGARHENLSKVYGGDGGAAFDPAQHAGGNGGHVLDFTDDWVNAGVVKGGKGGAGTPQGTTGTCRRAGKSTEVIKNKAASVAAAMSPFDCDSTGPRIEVGALLVQGDFDGSPSTILLDSLECTAITVDGAVAFDLCPTCIIDMRGNSGAVPIVQAGGSICIFGTVLTDEGVTPDMLFDPPPLISQVALPCSDALLAAPAPGAQHDAVRFSLLGGNPVRSGHPFSYELTLANGPEVISLELLDIAGRRLARSTPQILTAGTHRGEWAPCVATSFSPGVYFLVARANGTAMPQRVVTIR